MFFPAENSTYAPSIMGQSEFTGGSWDEEDIQTMGTQWLDNRAYALQYYG